MCAQGFEIANSQLYHIYRLVCMQICHIGTPARPPINPILDQSKHSFVVSYVLLWCFIIRIMKTVAYSCAAVANISTLQVLHPYIRSKQINEISYRKVPAILPVARDSTRRARGGPRIWGLGIQQFQRFKIFLAATMHLRATRVSSRAAVTRRAAMVRRRRPEAERKQPHGKGAVESR